MVTAKGKEAQNLSKDMGNMRLDSASAPAPPRQPPRPVARPPPPQQEDSESEGDDDDPFGDGNAVQTPAVEKGAPTW